MAVEGRRVERSLKGGFKMKDKRTQIHTLEDNEPTRGPHMSPLELIKRHGGKAHKVKGVLGRAADSMIAVYKDRFTYTFISRNEVASIHFDRVSCKIFYSGHNIENLKITSEQRKELFNVIKILADDSEGRELKTDYEATLGRLLADNK